MAWRIHNQIVRVIMDNRIPDIVTGSVWLAGRNDPLQLELQGNPRRDMAGCLLTLEHSGAVPDPIGGLATEQRGVCGDLTVSRKVKIPSVPVKQWLKTHQNEPFPFVWGNGVYLEWFSERNGRVVIELTDASVTLSEPSWRMTPEQEQEQILRNSKAMNQFVQCLSDPTQRGPAATVAICPVQLDALQTIQATAETDRLLEQKIRIESLKEQVRELSGGNMLTGGNENVPLDVQEQFWLNVLAFEQDSFPRRSVRDILAGDGFHPLPPDQLRDDEIGIHLRHLAEAMARRGLVLCQTDHLSDRDLYTLLIEHILEDDTEVFPAGSRWFTHVFISDLGTPDGESGVQVYLRYYADPETRKRWANEFPNDPMPPHDELPYDRDRWLPGSSSR